MASNLKLKNNQATTLTISNSDSASVDKVVIYLSTVEELATATGSNGDVAHVSDVDRGGIFIYDSTATENSGTVFGNWVRQYEGAVNVKWFGATGDGITDDTEAIQGAINSSDTVYIPSGTYYITSSLNVSSLVDKKIYGDGSKITIILSEITQTTASSPSTDLATATNAFAPSASAISTGNYVWNLNISGLKILSKHWDDSDYTNYSAGLNLNGTNCYIEDVEVEGFFANVVVRRWSNIFNSLIVRNGVYGIVGYTANACAFHVRMNYVPVACYFEHSTSVEITGTIEQTDNNDFASEVSVTPGYVLETDDISVVRLNNAYLERCGWTSTSPWNLGKPNRVSLDGCYLSPYSNAVDTIADGMRVFNLEADTTVDGSFSSLNFLKNIASVNGKTGILIPTYIKNLGSVVNSHITYPRPANQTRTGTLSSYSVANISSYYSSFISNNRGIIGNNYMINNASTTNGDYIEYVVDIKEPILFAGGFFPIGGIKVGIYTPGGSFIDSIVPEDNASYCQFVAFDVSNYVNSTVKLRYIKDGGDGTFRGGMFLAYQPSDFDNYIYGEDGRVLNFGASLASGASATVDTSITGSDTTKHKALVEYIETPISGLLLQSYITASGTVSVTATNTTASAIDASSIDVRVTVV
jgi:hypothetical protein